MADKKKPPRLESLTQKRLDSAELIINSCWGAYAILRGLYIYNEIFSSNQFIETGEGLRRMGLHGLIVAGGALASNLFLRRIVGNRSLWQEADTFLSNIGPTIGFTAAYAIGNNKGAEKYLKKIRAKSPNDPSVHSNLSLIQAKNNNFKDALDTLLDYMVLDSSGVKNPHKLEDHPQSFIKKRFWSREKNCLLDFILLSCTKSEKAFEKFAELKQAMPEMDQSKVLEMVLHRYLGDDAGFRKTAQELINRIEIPEEKESLAAKGRPKLILWESPEYPSKVFAIKEAGSREVKRQYEIESNIYSLMKKRLTPFPLGIFKREGTDYYFMEFSKSDTLSSAWRKKPASVDIEKVLFNLEQIQKQTSDHFYRFEGNVKQLDYREQISRHLEKAGKGSIDELIWALDEPIKYLEQNSFVFSHGDFHPGNILGSQIIDWESACFSTPFYDLVFLLEQPMFNVPIDKVPVFFPRKAKAGMKSDPALFYLTGLYVDLIISSRSSKWYQREGTEERQAFEKHFFGRMKHYLDNAPFDFDKKTVESILVKEFPEAL